MNLLKFHFYLPTIHYPEVLEGFEKKDNFFIFLGSDLIESLSKATLKGKYWDFKGITYGDLVLVPEDVC